MTINGIIEMKSTQYRDGYYDSRWSKTVKPDGPAIPDAEEPAEYRLAVNKVVNNNELTNSQREAAIEKLKKKFNVKPVHVDALIVITRTKQ